MKNYTLLTLALAVLGSAGCSNGGGGGDSPIPSTPLVVSFDGHEPTTQSTGAVWWDGTVGSSDAGFRINGVTTCPNLVASHADGDVQIVMELASGDLTLGEHDIATLGTG